MPWGKRLASELRRHSVVVAETRDPVQAGIWIDALERAGIAATTFERGVGAALGGAATPGWSAYPIVVSSEHLGANIIAELDGAAFLTPLGDRPGAAAWQNRAILIVAAVAGGIVVLALLAGLVSG